MPTDAPSTTDRHLEFEASFNFRDMGGYSTADGRRVRWRQIFRADAVHRLSGADLAPLGIRTVIDLRTPRELEERGRFGHDGIDFHHLPVMNETWEAAGTLPADDPPRYLADRYLDMLATGPDAIARSLRLLGDPRATPLVFHCAAGKDRTGVVAAFTLSLLGVDDGDVAADYALSNRATARWTEWLKREHPDRIAEIESLPTAFMQSPAEAMAQFLADIHAQWGSVEACAQAVLGVGGGDVAALRDNLLEPARR